MSDLYEDLEIPDFLLVKNRVPMTPEQRQAWEEKVKEADALANTRWSRPRPRGWTQADEDKALAAEKAKKTAGIEALNKWNREHPEEVKLRRKLRAIKKNGGKRRGRPRKYG